MSHRRWVPPAEDRAVGIGFYATSSEPIPGRLKSDPTDFLVEEISEYPRPDPTGAYTILRVRSSDWEQHELAQRIARDLHRPPHALSWAGTKDRRAVAVRLFSYRGPPPEHPLAIPRVEVEETYRAHDGISLGHHFGNRFSVRCSGLGDAPEHVVPRFEAVRQELADLGAIPNFFGRQRFGEVRPVTHLVGRALVLGDPEGAVETYLTFVPPDANGPGDLARREYAKDHDPVRALAQFPPAFRFERSLLDHLARGHTAERALRALSRDLRQLFLHAYQAWLFNRWLGLRWGLDEGALVPRSGDRLVRATADGTYRGSDPIPVGPGNLPEARDLVASDRARIAGPIVGYATPAGSTPADTEFERLLEAEGIGASAFRLPRTPELASAGTWRPATFRTPAIALAPDAGPADGPGLWLRFALPKGSYATVLLREFLKPGATSVPLESTQRF